MKFIKRISLKVFKLLGLSKGVSDEIYSIISRFRVTLIIIIVLSILIPFFELGFIGTLYVILLEENQQLFVERVNTLFKNDFINQFLIDTPIIYIMSLIGFILLLFFIISKIIMSKRLASLVYETFSLYSRKLLQSYLLFTPKARFGSEINKLTNAVGVEVSRFGNVAMEILLMMVELTTGLIFLFTAAYLSPLLFTISVLIGIAIFIFNKRGYRRAREIGANRILAQNSLLGIVLDILEGFKVIKIEGAEKKALYKAQKNIDTDQIWRYDIKWNAFMILIKTQGLLYIVLFTIIVVCVIVLDFDVALLLTFLIIIARLKTVLTAAQNHYLKIRQNSPSLDLVYDLIYTNVDYHSKYKDFDMNNKKENYSAITSLNLNNLNFHYKGGANIFNTSINHEFKAGDRILIQGESGEGKSTIMNLLLGYLEPTSGRIQYNGENFTDENFYKYREKIAYAAPDAYLFRDSILENLLLSGDYSEFEISDAVKKSKLEKVIKNIQGGIDGFIGKNGANLSLGEKQRVMLAKVFLKNPDVIFLDEATSNLDLKLEGEIIKDLLENVSSSSLVFVIAHKKPKNYNYNRAFILKEGGLKEVFD